MKVHQVTINENVVLVFDAPENATHAIPVIADGARYNIYKKGKILDCVVFDKTNTDEVLNDKYNNKYNNRFVNVGSLQIADESLVADLFTPVKNGNFYDYSYEGAFYPKAITVLSKIIAETGFLNPYILIVK